MISKIKDTISVYDMFSEGDRVLVGLSGGPDSVCLLYVLKRLAPAYKLKIFAAHLNHGFRGRESDGDEVFCRKLCGGLGVPFFSKKVKIKKTEDEARKARYAFFEEAAAEDGAAKIALGHNADDEAETVLMRLLRGAGVKGLSGIPPVRPLTRASRDLSPQGRGDRKKRDIVPLIVRPLVDVWKDEILSFLKERDINFRVDSSNEKLNFFRNRVRHELIPFLRRYNPNIKGILHNLGKNMAMTDEFLRDVVKKEYSKSDGIKISRLRKMPQIVCQELIREAAQCFEPKLNLTADQVNSILALISDSRGSKELCLPHNAKVVKEYDSLVFAGCKDKERNYELKLTVPGRLKIPFHNIFITSELCKKTDKRARNSFEVDMDYDKILHSLVQPLRARAGLVVRNRRPGDVFQPIGFRHEKKLKDIFIDEKIPRRVRDFLPLAAAGKDICWVPGYRIGEKFKIGPETKRVVKIKVEGLVVN